MSLRAETAILSLGYDGVTHVVTGLYKGADSCRYRTLQTVRGRQIKTLPERKELRGMSTADPPFPVERDKYS